MTTSQQNIGRTAGSNVDDDRAADLAAQLREHSFQHPERNGSRRSGRRQRRIVSVGCRSRRAGRRRFEAQSSNRPWSPASAAGRRAAPACASGRPALLRSAGTCEPLGRSRSAFADRRGRRFLQLDLHGKEPFGHPSCSKAQGSGGRATIVFGQGSNAAQRGFLGNLGQKRRLSEYHLEPFRLQLGWPLASAQLGERTAGFGERQIDLE